MDGMSLIPLGEAPAGPVFASTGPAGHRGRMRERLLGRGGDTLADYEVLEMLLFLGIRRGDTKPTAKGLINRFGSLGAVLAADTDALLAAGLDTAAAAPLRLVGTACDRLARAEARPRPILNSLERVEAHLRSAAIPAAAVVTGPRLLFLDNRNRLLADESAGPEKNLPLRAILHRALALHATALLVADTAGRPPTAEDGAQAARLAEAAGFLSVTVHDRVSLLDGRGIASCRALGLLRPPVRGRKAA